MAVRDVDRLQPCRDNPMYWQYRGKPVLLLGGSVEDNLFQIHRLEEHLDALAECGGNYVRCTMSSRDEGNVWPFERIGGDGHYDLERPGEVYWERLKRFLELTAERGIFVQFEMWDRFDFARDPWQLNPYNPKNNVNYAPEESGLAEAYPRHPASGDNPFFRTVPALDGNELLLHFQHAQVDRMLSVSLAFDHCLYCMDNETSEDPAWGAYWSGYIRTRAREAGRDAETTEMWNAHDITDEEHAATWRHPEIYSFCDISQNNHSPADRHARNLLWFREQILASPQPRPINTVKIYGANTGRYGTSRDGQERFWRNIFAGLAATRFHRPPSGLGLNGRARAHIRSMRMITDEMDVIRCTPRNDLISESSWNEAYCFARDGAEYAVFFPDGGRVFLDVSAVGGAEVTLRWLDIVESRWVTARTFVPEGGRVELTTPREEGYWAALVKK